MSTGRKPGRPRKSVEASDTSVEISTSAPEAELTNVAETLPTKRPRRTKIGARRNILSVEIPKGYHGRWVTDVDNGFRISQLLDMGYRFLEDKYLEVGDFQVSSNRQSTSILSRQVNRTGEIAYFMVIDEGLYQEYQADKQEIVNQSERAMNNPNYKSASLPNGAGLETSATAEYIYK